MPTLDEVRQLIHELDSFEAERHALDKKIEAAKARIEKKLAVSPSLKVARTQTPRHVPGRPDRGTGVFRAVRKLLSESPKASVSTLAEEGYGKDDARTRKNVRTVLYVLRKRGEIRASDDGGWEVVAKRAP